MDKVKFLMEKNSQILAELENIKKLTKSVNEVRSEITQINEDIEGVVGDISNNSSLLNELEEDIEEHTTSIANLSQSLSTISNDIDSIETNVSNLSSSLSNLADDVGDCETNISALQTETTTINGQIDDLTSEIDELASEIEDINNSLGNTSTNQCVCENLLINSSFLVNQRGASSYSQSNAGINKYTVDRLIHCMGSSFSLVPQAQGGITIHNSSSHSYVMFGQYIEKADSLLTGKAVTLSISVAGVVYSLENANLEVGESIEKQMNGGYFGIEYSSSGKYLCYFRVLAGMNITINWWKLEIGEKFTGYSLRSYAEELYLCQRYYLKKDCHWFYLYALNANTMWFNISLPSMRASPQVRLLNGAVWLRGESLFYKGISGMTLKNAWTSIQENVCDIGIEVSVSGFSVSKNILFADYVNLEFDAEIY